MAADATDHDREVVGRYFYTHTGAIRFVDKNKAVFFVNSDSVQQLTF